MAVLSFLRANTSSSFLSTHARAPNTKMQCPSPGAGCLLLIQTAIAELSGD